ncbi:unnamed protein product [Spirodela intermedia]|uniref:Uncharacterized protein n=1 Tax=Spirodela intermedia TaxID=51605 RepID=A0A7I8JIB2_SPIIN|nr:unnamed protein product [Spirodela intermedia]CAA6669898.1 unnamed protein product [Spirodela intermedia]
MFSVLADAGCTLCASGPPLLPTDTHKFRRRLECRFALLEGAPEQENPIIGQFLSGFSSYVSRSQNLHRILIPAAQEGLCGTTGSLPKAESLARVLLLVAPLQPRLQHLLLEKLPEHFDTVTVDGQSSLSSSALEDDIARLIVNQFRWLDFVLDPEGLSEKLMEVLSISPSPLKREIIGSLPEIIGDCGNCGALVEALERMLQEDSELVVPVLDAFSNINFACSQLDRTVDAEHLPDLLRFLLISADKGNQLRFFSVPEPFASRHKKLKGKSIVLCDAIFKELKCLNQPQHYKAIDVWLLVLIHVNGGSFQKSVEKILKKKIVDGCIQESLFDQCIQGQKNLVKVLSSLVTHVGSGVNFEVGSALDAMGLLTSKYSLELIPISSHVNGILDYLEGFNDDNLRKVYEVFCQLSFSHHINADSPGASIQRELVILVRKQLGNPDIRYKKMGIIGTSKIVSILGAMSASVSKWREALEFLRVSFDSCKLEPSALILLYDELGALVQCAKLKPAIMEWMGIHLGDFESVFVTDLERGQLLSTGLYVGLEEKLEWLSSNCTLVLDAAFLTQLSCSSCGSLSSFIFILGLWKFCSKKCGPQGIPMVTILGLHLFSKEETAPGFPTICPATFVVWYRTLHEENIAVLENLTKGIIFPKNRKEIPPENAKDVFWKLQQSVDVVVSLVHMCKIHDKVSVHALAVKYGGKFVDIFLKSFEFLEAHFQLYKDIVIQMVKELQKATRTIQILCSEAKRGAKRTMVTSRVPAAKRSMERFLFRVKAMLHNTSNGCSFWMGNLKHKGLLGQVVSSQLCVNEDEDGDEGGDGDGEAAPELLEADAGDSVAEGSEQGEETE